MNSKSKTNNYEVFARGLPEYLLGTFQTTKEHPFSIFNVKTESDDLDLINDFHRLIRECGSIRNYPFSELLLMRNGLKVNNVRDYGYPFVYLTQSQQQC